GEGESKVRGSPIAHRFTLLVGHILSSPTEDFSTSQAFMRPLLPVCRPAYLPTSLHIPQRDK
ncbi:MAG: hypothetical protein QW570_08240, partial [Candidatus Caldarchaeum sp.]